MLGLAALVALGSMAGEGRTPLEACLVASASLVALALALITSARGAAAALAAAALGLGVAAGAYDDLAYERTPLRAWTARQPGPCLARLEGVLVEDAARRHDQLVLVLDVREARVDGQPVDLRGRARIRVGGEAEPASLIAGDRVALWAELRAPLGYGNPGSLDPRTLLKNDGVHATGYVKTARLLEADGHEEAPAWRRLPAATRRWARAALLQALADSPERGIVVAMTLGDQTLLDEATAEEFRVAGTYHVLALSGAQVALLAGALILGLRRLGLGPWTQALLLTPALGFYALLVGAEVPIVRATVMALVALWGRACDLDVDVANLLGLTAFVLLLRSPGAVADVGFELSFAATLGLVLLTPVVVAAMPRLPWRLELALATSVAGQLALLPLLAARFHRLAPAAVVLNLVAVPLSGLVLLAGLAVLAAAAVSSWLASAIAPAAWLAAHLLRLSGAVVSHWPALDVRTPSPSPPTLVLYFAGLVLLLLPGRQRVAVLVLAVSLVAMVFPAAPADGRFHLTMLDVGQGDALILRTPRGRVWGIDAGGTSSGFDVGEAVVGPYLWSLPVRRLEGLAVTHAHVDHVGGVPFLLRHFSPRELWEGPAPLADPAYRLYAKAAAASSAPRRTVRRGTTAEIDGVRLEVIGPALSGRPPLKTRNDDSLVVRVTFGEVSLLMTGDVEAGGELALEAPAASVLKVPHHGSRTSSGSEFLRRVAPRVALLSVGARNRFGHPHPDVLARYAARGVRVFRTDRDGAVTISTDGRRIWVSTYRSGLRELVSP